MEYLHNLYAMYDAAVARKAQMMNADDLEDPQCAELMDIWLHSMKDIKTVLAMEDAGQDGTYRRGYRASGRYMEGNSGGGNSGGNAGGNSGGGYSARNRSRDSMGRYSHGDEKEEFVSRLEELMDNAPNEQMRNAARMALQEVNRM